MPNAATLHGMEPHGLTGAPSADQYAALEKSGHLATLSPPAEIEVKDDRASIRLQLPRQAVSLLVIDR